MLWLALIAAGLLAALIFVELSWRRRFAAQQAEFKRQHERDRTAHEQSLVQLRARQEAVFNSMTEGLLLLDGEGRITLANRAFEKLDWRSEEHTSELQSRQYLVCRLLLEKKKKNKYKDNDIQNKQR